MLIAERQLRQMIREFAMNEMPISFGDFSSPGGTSRGSASIGRKALSDPMGLEAAQVLFKNIDEDWFIITLEDTAQPEVTVKTPEFMQWLDEQGAGHSRVIVVADAPLEGDFDDVLWAIGHDVVGHGIWQLLKDHIPTELDSIQAGMMSDAIHQHLPEGLRLGGEGDVDPDILAGLFLGEMDPDVALAAAVSAIPDEPDPHGPAGMLVDAYLAAVADWISRFDPGVPILVRPFSDPPDK